VWNIKEVPDIKLSIWASDDNDARTEGWKAPAGDHSLLGERHALENGIIDISFPNTEVIIMRGQENVGEERRSGEHRGTEIALLLPDISDHVWFGHVFWRPHAPVQNK